MMTTTTASVKNERQGSTGLIAGFVLAIAGIGAWIYQLGQGLQITGLNQQIVWGLYIAAFFTAVGAGAALLAAAGISEYYENLDLAERKRCLLLALACFFTGGMLIAVDLGNPIHTLLIATAGKFTSMMTWDFWLLALSVLVTLAYLLVFKSPSSRKLVGTLGILSALAVVIVEAWMLSRLAAHPMWQSGFTVITFLVGAAIAGLSIALVAGAGEHSLHGWLKGLLWISLGLVIIELLTGLVGGSDEVKLVTAGFTAPAFWWQIVLGIAVPLFLLNQKSKLWLAGTLALSGVVAEKVWLLAAGQAKPWLDLPEGVYTPSWVELVAVIGLAGLGYLVYRLLMVIFKPE